MRGRVQGVWFRESTRIEAARVGATGWVRNLPDGSVEAEVQGSEEVVDRMLAFLRTGPPSAGVSGIEVTEVPVRTDEGFDVRH